MLKSTKLPDFDPGDLVARDFGTNLDVPGRDTQIPPMPRGEFRPLIEVYGRNGNMSKWLSDLKGDCPERDTHSLHERCDVQCPDLPKVL